MLKQIALTVSALLVTGSANGEPIEKPVSKLTKEEKVYLQRGLSYDQAVCVSEEIEFLSDTGSAKNVRISFDDESGGDIRFSFKDGFIRICGPDFMSEITGKERIDIDY